MATKNHGPDVSPYKPLGLWDSLTTAQQKRLLRLGFEQQSWDNNVREKVECGEFEMHSNGGTVRKRHEIMTGDRARKRSHPTSPYEEAVNA